MEKIRCIFIVILISNLLGQGALDTEVYFELINGDEIWVAADSEGRPTFWQNVTLNNNYQYASMLITSTDALTGFDLLDGDIGTQQIGYGLYKFNSDPGFPEFYYDTRDCILETGGGDFGSPDVTFTFNANTHEVYFVFWDWLGINNNFPINDGDTIKVWWSQIDDPQENPITHPHLYNFEPIEDCFYANILLSNEVGGINIGDSLFVDNLSDLQPSGLSVPLYRGYNRIITSKKTVVYNNQIYNHRHWNTQIEYFDHDYIKLIDENDEVISNFKSVVSSILSSSTTEIPISIQDPWYKAVQFLLCREGRVVLPVIMSLKL